MKNEKSTAGIVIICAILVAIVAVISIFTCLFGNHNISEPTCTEPAVCSKCGKQFDAPLGHEGTEATCTEASVCKRCGAELAPMLGHDFSDSNYQESAACSRCGTMGDAPLPADFETYGLNERCDAVLEEGYNYTTACWYDETQVTTGVVTYHSYYRTDGDDEREPLAGYEWVCVSVDLDFNDDAAWNYGVLWDIRNDDYYNVRLHDATFTELTDSDGGECYGFTTNYFGRDYTECRKLSKCVKKNWSGHNYRASYELSFRVPKGYDGIVVSVEDMSCSKEGVYVYDQEPACIEHFFRLCDC